MLDNTTPHHDVLPGFIWSHAFNTYWQSISLISTHDIDGFLFFYLT